MWGIIALQERGERNRWRMEGRRKISGGGRGGTIVVVVIIAKWFLRSKIVMKKQSAERKGLR